MVGDANANAALMRKIRGSYGAAIDAACKNSNVPASFLAALVANESGGNPDAKRFEKNVLAAIWEVLLGRKTAYGSIPAHDLFLFLVPGAYPPNGATALTAVITHALQQLDGLATSWGLTQVMGYHVLELGADQWSIDKLQDPLQGLRCSVYLLGNFAREFKIDPAADPTDLLNCWNSGHPAGDPKHPTFDPQYVPNGLARMKAYGELVSA